MLTCETVAAIAEALHTPVADIVAAFSKSGVQYLPIVIVGIVILVGLIRLFFKSVSIMRDGEKFEGLSYTYFDDDSSFTTTILLFTITTSCAVSLLLSIWLSQYMGKVCLWLYDPHAYGIHALLEAVRCM
jgi:hypothetical protein